MIAGGLLGATFLALLRPRLEEGVFQLVLVVEHGPARIGGVIRGYFGRWPSHLLLLLLSLIYLVVN